MILDCFPLITIIKHGYSQLFGGEVSPFFMDTSPANHGPFEVSAVHFGCEKVVRCLLRANAQWDKACVVGREMLKSRLVPSGYVILCQQFAIEKWPS